MLEQKMSFHDVFANTYTGKRKDRNRARMRRLQLKITEMRDKGLAHTDRYKSFVKEFNLREAVYKFGKREV